MNSPKKLLEKPTALALVISSVMIRLLPHPPNFTPLGATAIFGGKQLGRPWNYLAPLLILFVTDLFLGFHALMPYVYSCFIFSVWLAERTLKKTVNTSKLTALAIINSVTFFIVTNFGVWAQGLLYPRTGAGLMESYLMGLPFLRNMLASDLIFTLGFFALYTLAQKQSSWHRFDNRLAVWLLRFSDRTS